MPKIALAGLLFLACAAQAVAGSPFGFTAAQAAAGASLYRAKCVQCHGAHLQGVTAPALRGGAIMQMRSGAEVYEFMATQMPLANPGSLTPAQYASLMAFILKANGHRAGKTPLTAASAKKITTPI